MKRWYTLLMIFLAGSLVAGAALTEDELENLDNYVNLNAVNDDDFEDENEVEYVELTFRTNQNDDYTYKFFAKVFVELEDKKTKTVCHAQAVKQKPATGSDYNGTDRWRVLIPYGEMKRPKVSAYVVQYGVMDGGKFVVIAEDMDDVDSVEELLERSSQEVKVAKFENQYDSIDSDGEVRQSEWK
jgi:hypothetical protein